MLLQKNLSRKISPEKSLDFWSGKSVLRPALCLDPARNGSRCVGNATAPTQGKKIPHTYRGFCIKLMANDIQMEVCLKLKTERGAERVEGTIRVGPEDFSFEPVAGGCIGSFRCGANTHEGFARSLVWCRRTHTLSPPLLQNAAQTERGPTGASGEKSMESPVEAAMKG